MRRLVAGRHLGHDGGDPRAPLQALDVPALHDHPVEVAIKDFSFQPASVAVSVGQTVSWTNEDGEPHAVRSQDGSIASPVVGRTPSVWTAEGEPGAALACICSIHPSMRGTVTIEAEPPGLEPNGAAARCSPQAISRVSQVSPVISLITAQDDCSRLSAPSANKAP